MILSLALADFGAALNVYYILVAEPVRALSVTFEGIQILSVTSGEVSLYGFSPQSGPSKVGDTIKAIKIE